LRNTYFNIGQQPSKFSAICPGLLSLATKTTKNLKTHMFATCAVCHRRVGFLSENGDTSAGKAASWATVSAGSGYEQACKIFSLMSIKFMDRKTFNRNLDGCPELWSETLEGVMVDNGKEEARLAIAAGDVGDDGTVEISVVTDGGYALHSHGNFGATSGAVSTFGTRTKKLLDLRVANRYCGVCKNKGKGKAHKCFKCKTDKGTESALTLRSFQESEKRLNVRFKQLVSDNDVTIKKTLAKELDHEVEKADCVEHVFRILKRNLYKVNNILS
jgi:hypothetical protein